MRQLDLFRSDPTRTLMCSMYLTLGDLIKVNGELFEIDSVHRHTAGNYEYTYRSYEGPL